MSVSTALHGAGMRTLYKGGHYLRKYGICAMVFLIPIKVCSRSDYQVGHSNKICLIESGICGMGVSL